MVLGNEIYGASFGISVLRDIVRDYLPNDDG